MSNVTIADRVSQSFIEFTNATPTEHLSYGAGCLADFIQGWLWSGIGVRACNGDFQTFTIAMIAIIDEWNRDPGITDYVPESDDDPIVARRADTVFGEAGYHHRVLDRFRFDATTFAMLHKQ